MYADKEPQNLEHTQARLDGANLREVNLSGVNLFNANLKIS